jgi:glycosyltransferase involved in cell wall biosynthesis
MALIAFDARDASVAMPHGSGIYVRRLLEALIATTPPGHENALWPIHHAGLGPEVLFEQFGLPRQLRRRHADLVHGPDSFLPLVRGCPGVLTVHDLAFLAMPGDMPARTELKYRALVPRAARSAQRVICPSRFTAEDLEGRCGVASERIRVIPEAPALAFGSLPAPEGPYLLAVGDLRPKKNLEVLVRAFGELHARGLPHRLILAGADLGQGATLAALAAGAPLELPGFVSDAELDALIRGAAVVVIPGVYEGFGLAALDAMARGRPTVLARAGALPEVGAGATEYFEPTDAGELTTVLAGLLSSPVRRAALGVAGLARAGEFSWEATAQATWRVYEELL